MKVKIRKIGNSQGVILPKEVIERCKLYGEVEITVSDDQVIIKSGKSKRSTWEADFQMAVEKDDGLLDNVDLIQNEWDSEEWEW